MTLIGFAEQDTDIVENLAGAVTVFDHPLQSQPRLLEIGRRMAKKSQRRPAVRGNAGQRLSHLMSNRRRHRLQVHELVVPLTLQVRHRAAELIGALAQLVEQPGILNGDNGLGGKILNDVDLLVGEGTDFAAANRERADQLVVLEHRHSQRRAHARKLDGGNRRRAARGISPIRGQVGDVNQRFMHQQAAAGGIFVGPVRHKLARFGKSRRHIVGGDELQDFAVPAVDGAVGGVADPNGIRQYGFENALDVAGGAGDDAKHLRGRLLQLRRLGEFTPEPRDLCRWTGRRGTAAARRLWRAAALRRRFAASPTFPCFGVPSHCLPRGSRQPS